MRVKLVFLLICMFSLVCSQDTQVDNNVNATNEAANDGTNDINTEGTTQIDENTPAEENNTIKQNIPANDSATPEDPNASNNLNSDPINETVTSLEEPVIEATTSTDKSLSNGESNLELVSSEEEDPIYDSCWKEDLNEKCDYIRNLLSDVPKEKQKEFCSNLKIQNDECIVIDYDQFKPILKELAERILDGFNRYFESNYLTIKANYLKLQKKKAKKHDREVSLSVIKGNSKIAKFYAKIAWLVVKLAIEPIFNYLQLGKSFWQQKLSIFRIFTSNPNEEIYGTLIPYTEDSI